MHFRNDELIFGWWPLAFGVLCAWLAHRKNRNEILWGVLGAVFVLFALIFILCLPHLPKRDAALAVGGRRRVGGAVPHSNAAPTVLPPAGIPGFTDVVWHVGVDEVARGPLAFEELRALWKVRAFGFDSFVWTPGMPKWRPVRRIPGMAIVLSA